MTPAKSVTAVRMSRMKEGKTISVLQYTHFGQKKVTSSTPTKAKKVIPKIQSPQTPVVSPALSPLPSVDFKGSIFRSPGTSPLKTRPEAPSHLVPVPPPALMPMSVESISDGDEVSVISL
eukprot:gnl/Dysnectes_brevis/10787_a21865_186.p1 GENE.gnl/Dysnectes_brevis/10787_a21865_186~~gnl/Dysnectes_brevis/10787_a21865_186.p1  ORF type:complete len:120 (+),score=10.81 gnl/Dysnectes_brevis/10787_a21865_186:2-361(+)